MIIEDFPGVGKTMLAKSLARSLDVDFSRIQFTPDLLPSDVTGVNVFNQRTNEFEFRPGPVFANVLLVDEINRASPKTQAALLEAMQENQVTIDGESYPLEPPVHRARDAEPDRVRGHVSAAGGPAGPLLDAPLARLSAARRRSAHAERADDRAAARDADAGRRNRRDPRRDRRGALALRRGEPEPLRRRPAPPHALELAALRLGPARGPESRCCASRRPGRWPTAGTTCSRTTSRRSRGPCSRTG